MNRFDNLSMMLASLIHDTVTKSLAVHNAFRETDILFTCQSHRNTRINIFKDSTFTGHKHSLSIRTRSGKTSPRYVSVSFLIHDDLVTLSTNCVVQNENLMRSEQLNKRGPKRQNRNKSVFNVWFGRIELTTLTTEQEDDIDSDCILPMCLRARQTSFRVVPNSYFLSFSLVFETGETRPTISHPGWDNRLRVIRNHIEDSPVYDVICRTDYANFRQLVESREVTPFDLVEYEHLIQCTLFEIVVQKIELQALRGKHVLQRGLFRIAKFLADSGVDCGVGESLLSSLYALVWSQSKVTLDLIRIIMAQSQTDPFAGLARVNRSIARIGYPHTRLSVLTKQDQWDLSEFTKLVEDD